MVENVKIRTRNLQTDNRGVTFIDMVLAMMILGFLLMIAVPRFQSTLTHTKLNEASIELILALQYAGDMAATYQRPFSVSVDVGENGFNVRDYQYRNDVNAHHDGTPPVDTHGLLLNPADKKWYTKDFDTHGNYDGVKITSGADVCFYPDGHSSDTDHTFVLSYGDQQRTITVNGVTRRITVQ
jgi:Tfp pilus assembly protein FimT